MENIGELEKIKNGIVTIPLNLGCPRKCTFCGYHKRNNYKIDIEKTKSDVINITNRYNCHNIFLADGEPTVDPTGIEKLINDFTEFTFFILTGVYNEKFNYNDKNIIYSIHLENTDIKNEFNNILKIKNTNPKSLYIYIINDDLTLEHIDEIVNFIQINKIPICVNYLTKSNGVINESYINNYTAINREIKKYIKPKFNIKKIIPKDYMKYVLNPD